jgi:hypothetical protein
MSEAHIGKRWGGLDWADQKKEILIIGQGGIGSWLTLSLSRICHDLVTFDGDSVDVTNVEGGQLYRTKDIGKKKVMAVSEVCREFGCVNSITTVDEMYTEECGALNVTLTGLDNMVARKIAFSTWKEHVISLPEEERSKCLFMDGRLLAEVMEIITVHGHEPKQIQNYLEQYMFDDSEVPDLDCTAKQTSFAAMGIASIMTATLCNWLTNQKNGFDLREVPFYQRLHLPMMQQKHSNQVPTIVEKIVEVEKEVPMVGVNEAYPGELEKLRNFHSCVGALHGAALIPKKQEIHIYAKQEEAWSQ